MEKIAEKHEKDGCDKKKAKGKNSEKTEIDCEKYHCYFLEQIELSNEELERMCGG